MSIETILMVGHGSDGRKDAIAFEKMVQLHQTLSGVRTRAAFLSCEPKLKIVLRSAVGPFRVIPWFMSDGYMVNHVLRRDIPDAEFDQPIGVHPIMDRYVDAHIEDAIARGASKNASVVIVGHGTRRNAQSGDSTWAQSHRLREIGRVAESAFLDMDPDAKTAMKKLPKGDVIIVPFFIFEGGHASKDVPLAFKFNLVDARRAGHHVGAQRFFYGPTFLHHPILDEFIKELAG